MALTYNSGTGEAEEWPELYNRGLLGVVLTKTLCCNNIQFILVYHLYCFDFYGVFFEGEGMVRHHLKL